VVVDKHEVIQKMVEIAEELNCLATQGHGISDADIAQMAERSRPHLYMVQSEIYNALYQEGIIKAKN